MPTTTSFVPARTPKRALLRLGGAAAMLSLAALTGCVVYPNGAVAPIGSAVYVNEAPPAPIYETVPAAPAVGMIWIPGFWNWLGGRYM